MPLIQYVDKKLGSARLAVIRKANEIIKEYEAQGYQLTLRQLYYQFVARDLIANNQKEYNKLGETINEARLCGLVDWNSITDRTRNLRDNPHWTSPRSIIQAASSGYAIDKWSTQRFRVEVWIEKDALAGVVEGICSELDVPYLSCRGYTSQSEMWVGAMRLKRHSQNGQIPLILHFGDHDPSGRDMSRDILDRMKLFMGGVQFERLALNFDQIEQYNPPPNPAKVTDSRAAAYIAEFGDESWELDALEPRVLTQLVRDAVEAVRDEDAWEEKVAEENHHRDLLAKASTRWSEVVSFLERA